MASNYTFQGWMGLDKNSAKGNMVWQSYTPKPFEETDVDIKITHCGICGSDLHTLRSGWGASLYPVCVGHEIVGTAVRVGSKVENGIMSGLDWFATFVAWAGNPNIVDELKKGKQLGDRTYKVHLDGYDQTPMLTGKGSSNRHEIFYLTETTLAAVTPVRELLVAPLLLIPFIENAFKYVSDYDSEKNYVNMLIIPARIFITNL